MHNDPWASFWAQRTVSNLSIIKYTVHPWTEGKARALERDADYSKGGYITASPELGIFERTDMYIDVHIDMCADMCMDMSTCIGMREYGHVYGHIKASRRRTS